MLNPAWDLTLYLGCVQLLLLRTLWIQTGPAAVVVSPVRLALLFSAAMVLFWLTWGGYSVDAWRYLSRFDRNPLDFLEEQLFWLLGFGLGWLLPDPWPMKVLSALFVTGLVSAYLCHHRQQRDWRFVMACLLLPATPAFMLLGGNAVRQGLAGVIGLFAAVWLLDGRPRRAMLLAIPAFLVHQYSLVIFVALGVVRFARGWLLPIWIGAFFISPLARELAALAGISLDHRIAYATYTEGQFHWSKLAVSAVLSLLVLISIRVHRSPAADFRHLYLALVCCSHALLMYEVPFERVLLFADLAAPGAVAQALWLACGNATRPIRAIAVGVVSASVLLWSSRSITFSLGYL